MKRLKGNLNDTDGAGGSWADAIAEIKKIVPATNYLQKAKKGGYICPFCGSGSGPNGTGAQYYKDTNLLCCFAGCDRKTYDVIDIWGKVYNVDYKTAVSDLAELANIPLPGSENSLKTAQNTPARTAEAPIKKEPETAQIKPKTDYSAYFKECADRLSDPAALAYLSSRGISQDTAKRFNLGFDPEADPAKRPGAAQGEYKPHPAPRLIVPMGKYSFTGRRTDGGEDFKKTIAKDGHTGLTVPENFRNSTGVIFITEGAFDALAIMEAVPETRAISLNSTNNAELLIKSISADKTAFLNDYMGEYWPVIVCLDNDNAGRQAQHFLLSELKALGLPCVGTNLEATEGEDPNDILTKYGKEEMRKRVFEAIESIKNAGILDDFGEIDVNKVLPLEPEGEDEQEAAAYSSLSDMVQVAPGVYVDPLEEIEENNRIYEKMLEEDPEFRAEEERELKETAEYFANLGKKTEAPAADPEDNPPQPKKAKLQAFYEKIQTEAYKPQETGLAFFDDLIGGGIMQQSIMLLLAAPSVGKTTLCQQIAEEMAERKRKVIYLCFEMSEEQMLAKAISYRLARRGIRTTAEEVLQGYKWTPERREIVEGEISRYEESASNYITYYNGARDDVKETDLEALQIYLTKTGEAAKQTGENGPAIILDYLQLLTGPADNETQIVKAAMQIIKDYVTTYNSFAICVVAVNRGAMIEGRITLNSGRDSSNIEYGGDYLLSLQYYDIDQGRVKPTDPEAVSNLMLEPWRRMILRVLKHRLGTPGKSANLYFRAAYNFFASENQMLLPYWPPEEVKNRAKFIPKSKDPTPQESKPAKPTKEDLEAAADEWNPEDEENTFPT